MGDTEETLGSWLQSGSAANAVAIWGMIQWITDIFSDSFVNFAFPIKIHNLKDIYDRARRGFPYPGLHSDFHLLALNIFDSTRSIGQMVGILFSLSLKYLVEMKATNRIIFDLPYR